MLYCAEMPSQRRPLRVIELVERQLRLYDHFPEGEDLFLDYKLSSTLYKGIYMRFSIVARLFQNNPAHLSDLSIPWANLEAYRKILKCFAILLVYGHLTAFPWDIRFKLDSDIIELDLRFLAATWASKVVKQIRVIQEDVDVYRLITSFGHFNVATADYE